MMTSSISTFNTEQHYPIRILFICLGNICRSPAAEGVMKAMVEQANLEKKYFIDSAGIGNWHVGELPDRRMREHAYARGYRLDSRARQFQDSDLDEFDYIITMDEENYKNISRRAMAKNQLQKVVRMKDYFRKYAGEEAVPDPYYGGAQGFNHALDLIEDGCSTLLETLESR